jgi:uncharacterized UBP type Zn finger protein
MPWFNSVSAPIITPPTSEGSAASLPTAEPYVVQEQAVADLVDMGFERDAVISALKLSAGNVNQAVQKLLN